MRKLKKLKILNAVINISRYVCICIALTEILSLLGLIEELSYDTNLVLCTVAGICAIVTVTAYRIVTKLRNE